MYTKAELRALAICQGESTVSGLAEELAAGAPHAQWFAKRSINEARAGLETGLELEAAYAALAFDTEDKAEGMAAFVEKREPEFGGTGE